MIAIGLMRAARFGSGAVALALLLAAPSVAEVWVLCDVGSGDVEVEEAVDEGRHAVMEGPLPGRRTAGVWVEENCPARRCNAEGRCAEAGAATDGWVAGEVTSVTLSAPPEAVPPTPRVGGPGAGPGGSAGPPTADLSPLINNTKAAAKGCNFPVALVSVDHMANFDPQHPFLVANRDNLRSLARRQRRTEETVWQSSSALQGGDLKGARVIAQAAADTAVSCQSPAVAALLDGIDVAIKQTRELKTLKRRQAASRLLPGLIGLSNALIGAQSGVPIDVEALMANTAATFGADLPLNVLDPCAFKYDYRDTSSLEPACSCAGYEFDPQRFRCAR